MRLLRFTVGRWLMHLGLIVMPPGRVRRELHRMLMDWSLQVGSGKPQDKPLGEPIRKFEDTFSATELFVPKEREP
jgi:hypothetical protein